MAANNKSKVFEDFIVLTEDPRSVRTITDLEEKFQKELKRIELDDVMSTPNINLETLMQMIKGMRNHRIVLEQGQNTQKRFIVFDFDVKVGECLALRKNKVLGTGTYQECAAMLLQQMKREFPDKFTDTTVEMIDEMYLKQVAQVHFGNPRVYRIIICT